MTQPGRREATNAPTDVITVADLLSRYSPAADAPGLEAPTVPVSVAGLLRREGHPSPRRVERPFGDDAYDYEDEPRRRTSPPVVKRGAIAAGVLLATGTAFGAVAVVTTGAAPVNGTDALAEQRTPDRDWLSEQSSPARPDLAPDVATAPLDPGSAPDDSWLQVAFPRSAGDEPAPADPSSSDGEAEAAAGGDGPDDDPAPGGGDEEAAPGDEDGDDPVDDGDRGDEGQDDDTDDAPDEAPDGDVDDGDVDDGDVDDGDVDDGAVGDGDAGGDAGPDERSRTASVSGTDDGDGSTDDVPADEPAA